MSNRLALEDSPYLQQHKENPVDWYPWCDEAFTRAKNENKAIFISIGYSSCHWCHVMEHEVFENEEIATFLNEYFISIKVDREERPDIDKHYQEIHTLLNRRSGGWPTSIVATPDNKPFFAATYMPAYQKEHIMGFNELINIIATKVSENDKKLFDTAAEIQEHLASDTRATQATVLKESIAQTFLKQAEHNYDPLFGGFSEQPKFPHASTLGALLDIYLLEESEKAKEMVEHSLSKMQRGGLYDLVEGGFCRYSVDRKWLVPHFEKMTYDNGLLCELYTRASQHLKNESFLRTATEIADFMLKRMQENHLFYSASDADTEGEDQGEVSSAQERDHLGEGKYFIYDIDEVKKALMDDGFQSEEINEIIRLLHITPKGNFEGSSIVRLEMDTHPQWFKRVRSVLKRIRENRIYPFIDKKVQVSWNAMMIKALFILSRHNEQYLGEAKDALKTLLDTMFIDDELYHSTLINKKPKIRAFLEDYAYLGTALVAAYERTCNDYYLIIAQQMANKALEMYFDNGRWYFSRGEFITEAETTDSSYPGAIGVMVDLLLSLGSLGEEKYRHFAFKSIEYYSAKMARTPIAFPYFFSQTLRYIKGDRVIKARRDLLEKTDVLLNIRYPYTLIHADPSASEFLICGENSCFASTKNPEELSTLIRHSL